MSKAKENLGNAIDEMHELLEKGGHLKGIKSKDAPVNEWLNTNEGYSATVLAVQEWGVKNNLRLFGIMMGRMDLTDSFSFSVRTCFIVLFYQKTPPMTSTTIPKKPFPCGRGAR